MSAGARLAPPRIGRLGCALALAFAVLAEPAAANDRRDDRLAADGWAVDARSSMDRVQLTIRREAQDMHWTSSFPIALAELQGLSRGDLDGRRAPVRFELRRQAGVFHFDGSFTARQGEGRYRFAADPAFLAGLAHEGYANVDANDVFTCALQDVTLETIRGFKALGYDPISLDDVKRLSIHGVTPEIVRAYRREGLRHLSVDELARLSIHGVRPDIVHDLASLGYRDLEADDLVRMAIHGASPEYVRALQRLNYRGIPAESLIRMRIHGVTPEYVQALLGLGYTRVPDEELIRMCIHGVTPEFIRRVEARSADRPSVEELIQLRLRSSG